MSCPCTVLTPDFPGVYTRGWRTTPKARQAPPHWDTARHSPTNHLGVWSYRAHAEQSCQHTCGPSQRYCPDPLLVCSYLPERPSPFTSRPPPMAFWGSRHLPRNRFLLLLKFLERPWLKGTDKPTQTGFNHQENAVLPEKGGGSGLRWLWVWKEPGVLTSSGLHGAETGVRVVPRGDSGAGGSGWSPRGGSNLCLCPIHAPLEHGQACTEAFGILRDWKPRFSGESP